MEHLTGAKSSNWSKIRLVRVSVKRRVGLGSGPGSGSIFFLFYFFFSKNAILGLGLGLILTLTQILAPRFTDTCLVPCDRSLRPHISKTLSSIFFAKFRKRHISSLKKRVPNRSFQSLSPVRDFPSIP